MVLIPEIQVLFYATPTIRLRHGLRRADKEATAAQRGQITTRRWKKPTAKLGAALIEKPVTLASTSMVASGVRTNVCSPSKGPGTTGRALQAQLMFWFNDQEPRLIDIGLPHRSPLTLRGQQVLLGYRQRRRTMPWSAG